MEAFDLTPFEYEVLKLYLKYGYGQKYLYELPFFEDHYTSQTVLMTLMQFTNAVNKRRAGYDMG